MNEQKKKESWLPIVGVAVCVIAVIYLFCTIRSLQSQLEYQSEQIIELRESLEVLEDQVFEYEQQARTDSSLMSDFSLSYGVPDENAGTGTVTVSLTLKECTGQEQVSVSLNGESFAMTLKDGAFSAEAELPLDSWETTAILTVNDGIQIRTEDIDLDYWDARGVCTSWQEYLDTMLSGYVTTRLDIPQQSENRKAFLYINTDQDSTYAAVTGNDVSGEAPALLVTVDGEVVKELDLEAADTDNDVTFYKPSDVAKDEIEIPLNDAETIGEYPETIDIYVMYTGVSGNQYCRRLNHIVKTNEDDPDIMYEDHVGESGESEIRIYGEGSSPELW